MSEIDMKAPADFLIDGRNLGGVNYGEVLVFEVPAGRYRFSWAERTNTSSPLQSPNIELTVQNGDLVYLRTYVNISASIGLLRAAINPPINTLQHIMTGGTQMISSFRPVSVRNSDFNVKFGRPPQTVLPSGAATQPSAGRTTEDRLRDLIRLRNSGMINASEYNQRRNNILDGL